MKEKGRTIKREDYLLEFEYAIYFWLEMLIFANVTLYISTFC